jgi:hypothetical protein
VKTKKHRKIMTHQDITTKQRYTLLEVQRIATDKYNLMVMPHTSKSYAIFFQNQLVAVFKKLVEVVGALPSLYEAIIEQLTEKEVNSYDTEIAQASNYLDISEELAPQVRLQSIDKNFIPNTTRYHYSLYTPDGAYIKSVEIFPQLEDKETATQKVMSELKKVPLAATEHTATGNHKNKNTFIMSYPNDFVLETIEDGATDFQVAYCVKDKISGQRLGLIFDVHDYGWQCGTEETYKYPADAIEGLINLLIKFGCPIPDHLIKDDYQAAA